MKIKVKCVTCKEEYEVEDYQLVNNGKDFECFECIRNGIENRK